VYFTVRNNSSKGLSSQFSASDLLDKADELIDQFQYDLAEKFCQRAVDLEPDNIRAIETRGFLMLQAGDTDQAKAVFFE
jgi:Flp pilus assembly protein TadD